MAGMIKSIFGLTPAQQQEEYLKQQRALAAQLTRQGTNPAVAQFGTGLGAGLARGLLSRMGIEDPAMVKAQEAEARQLALNEQLAELEPEDPRRMLLVSQALQEAGDIEGAAKYATMGFQLEQIKKGVEQGQQRADAATLTAQTGARSQEARERQADEQLAQAAEKIGVSKAQLQLQIDKFGLDNDKFEESLKQFAQKHDLDVRAQDELREYRNQSLVNEQARIAASAQGNIDAFTPSAATGPEMRQLENIIKDSGIKLNKTQREAYANDLNTRLQNAKNAYEKRVEAGEKLPPYNTDRAIKMLIKQDEEQNRFDMRFFRKDKLNF